MRLVRTSRIDHSAMPPRARWRDVAAAWLVCKGLDLASDRGAGIAAELAAVHRARLDRPAGEPAGCRPVDPAR